MSIAALGGLRRRLRENLEDYVFTPATPMFFPAFALDVGEEEAAAAAVAQLTETGGFEAGVKLAPATIASVCVALAEAYAGRRPELHIATNDRMGMLRILNPLQVHPALVVLATDRFLCAVVERYLRRRVVLADVDQRRVLPMDMEELDRRVGARDGVGSTSSHWHRDTRGRQVKVMVYLTDVTKSDSNFAIVPGTHRDVRRGGRGYEASRIGERAIAAGGLAPREFYGSAGTTMIFDTHVIHRLRRSGGARVRDSVTFYYTPGQQTRVLDIAPEALAGVPPAGRALFENRWWAAPRADEAGRDA